MLSAYNYCYCIPSAFLMQVARGKPTMQWTTRKKIRSVSELTQRGAIGVRDIRADNVNIAFC